MRAQYSLCLQSLATNSLTNHFCAMKAVAQKSPQKLSRVAPTQEVEVEVEERLQQRQTAVDNQFGSRGEA